MARSLRHRFLAAGAARRSCGPAAASGKARLLSTFRKGADRPVALFDRTATIHRTARRAGAPLDVLQQKSGFIHPTLTGHPVRQRATSGAHAPNVHPAAPPGKSVRRNISTPRPAHLHPIYRARGGQYGISGLDVTPPASDAAQPSSPDHHRTGHQVPRRV